MGKGQKNPIAAHKPEQFCTRLTDCSIVLEPNNGFAYRRNDMLQITDITAVIYLAVGYKNLVHTSSITAVHNLTSVNNNIGKIEY